MPQKKYLITLRDEEREPLAHLLHSGTHATRTVTSRGKSPRLVPRGTPATTRDTLLLRR
jgi:hypothetical protein